MYIMLSTAGNQGDGTPGLWAVWQCGPRYMGRWLQEGRCRSKDTQKRIVTGRHRQVPARRSLYGPVLSSQCHRSSWSSQQRWAGKNSKGTIEKKYIQLRPASFSWSPFPTRCFYNAMILIFVCFDSQCSLLYYSTMFEAVAAGENYSFKNECFLFVFCELY